MNARAVSECQQLYYQGCLVLRDIVPPDRIKAMRDRLEELVAVTLQEHSGHSAVQNRTNEPRLAKFTCFSRRDSPTLLLNPLPDPSPEILGRFDAEVQGMLKSLISVPGNFAAHLAPPIDRYTGHGIQRQKKRCTARRPQVQSRNRRVIDQPGCGNSHQQPKIPFMQRWVLPK